VRDFIRYGGVLLLITASVALVLAAGNQLTEQKIYELDAETRSAAAQEVLRGIGEITANSGITHEVKEGTSVLRVLQYNLNGADSGVSAFVAECAPAGYGGAISVTVGVDTDLRVTGVSITDNSKETPGLGARVGEPAFYRQYTGKTEQIGVSKGQPSENEVQAVTGATISSTAVTKGVNDAVDAVREVLGR
jgi:electron transport complex protein RnfG